jgi:hypothetical protein
MLGLWAGLRIEQVCWNSTNSQEEEGLNKSLTGTMTHGSSARTERLSEFIFGGRKGQSVKELM